MLPPLSLAHANHSRKERMFFSAGGWVLAEVRYSGVCMHLSYEFAPKIRASAPLEVSGRIIAHKMNKHALDDYGFMNVHAQVAHDLSRFNVSRDHEYTNLTERERRRAGDSTDSLK